MDLHHQEISNLAYSAYYVVGGRLTALLSSTVLLSHVNRPSSRSFAMETLIAYNVQLECIAPTIRQEVMGLA